MTDEKITLVCDSCKVPFGFILVENWDDEDMSILKQLCQRCSEILLTNAVIEN